MPWSAGFFDRGRLVKELECSCHPPCQIALGIKGGSELTMMAHPKRASKPSPLQRLLIQLFNNLRRETCREAFKKRVAAPCSYLGPAGGPTALPTGFGLVSYCLQWALSRRGPLAIATRHRQKSNLSLRWPPYSHFTIVTYAHRGFYMVSGSIL